MFWEESYIRSANRQRMDRHLYKYLVLHKHLNIPQLGSFVVEKEHARYDAKAGLLYPPVQTVVFSPGVNPISEKLFFDFLALELAVDEASAIQQFHDFAFRFRTRLSEEGHAEVEGVGRLTKQEGGGFAFESAPYLSELLPPLRESEPVVTEEASEEEEEAQKDNWWIYAIVLLILGAGALLFYYS